MAESEHYVANIKIDKVTKTTGTNGVAPKRDVTEGLNLTIKAETFTTLQEKIAAHVGIMDEKDVSL